mmetsp:Transcript_119436/g.380962  ORF Transcript_119436/g.380962 Transcript_119436/m.380962 type:complete len:340 (-) Transcript_119436:4132-5151(-)
MLHAEAAEKHDVVGINQRRGPQETLLVRDLHVSIRPPRGTSSSIDLALAGSLVSTRLSVDTLWGDNRLQACGCPVLREERTPSHCDIYRGGSDQERLSHLWLIIVSVQSQPIWILPLLPLVPPRAAPIAPVGFRAPGILLPSTPPSSVAIVLRVACCGLAILFTTLRGAFLLLGAALALGRLNPSLVGPHLCGPILVARALVDEPRAHQLLAQAVAGAQQLPQPLRHEEARGRVLVGVLHIVAKARRSLQLGLEGLGRCVDGQQVARGVEAALVGETFLALAGWAHEGTACSGDHGREQAGRVDALEEHAQDEHAAQARRQRHSRERLSKRQHPLLQLR